MLILLILSNKLHNRKRYTLTTPLFAYFNIYTRIQLKSKTKLAISQEV